MVESVSNIPVTPERYKEAKKNLKSLELSNQDKIMLLRYKGTGEWYEIAEHSALFYYYKVCDKLANKPNFENDSDSYYYPYEIDPLPGLPGKTVETIRNTVNDAGGFDVSFSGSAFETRKMIREMILVLLIAVVILFLILASQFESLIQPLIILAEIIIDIAVSLGILWLLGIGINLMSLIGLVVITGIVINDSILKIDAINRLRSAGADLEDAIHEAGHRRLNAIIMTSLTTILSVVPFLRRGSMGDDLQYPMSVVIIAGMLVGTLVSLFLVPALYAAIYRRKG